MTKIGLIIHSEASYGGIDQYSKSMVDALNMSKKFNLVLFTNEEDSRFDNYDCSVKKFSKTEKRFGQKLFFRAALISKSIRNLYLSKEERKIFKNVDILLSPTISFYPHFFLNKPFAFTLHDLQEKYFPDYFSLRERMKRFFFKKKLSNASAGIICESESVKDDIQKFIGVKKRKIHVIPAPPPKKFFSYEFDKQELEDVRNKYQLNYKYLFYPAQMWYHKNHLRLLDAFNVIKNKFPDLNLVFTGGKKNNFNNIKQKIDDLDLNGKVNYLGYVDYEELPYIFKMSEMLVMPTLFESISIPIYEAFSLKVPVCCSNVTGLPEQVGDAGLLFDPYDVTDIADKISELLLNKDLSKEIGMRGYKRASNMNHANYTQKLDSLISEILDN